MASDTAPQVGPPEVDTPEVVTPEVGTAEVGAPDLPTALSDDALDRIFRNARTVQRFSSRPVPESLLRALYDLVKLGPTSGNCSPARFVFLHSADSRERLRGSLSGGNVERAMNAGATVIVAYDPLFYEQMPRLYPQAEARSWFAADATFAEETAFRNATLQGGYMILAARMLGLDVAPMSGFDNAKVDEMFLGGQGWRSNFLLNLGYADGLPDAPRAPRLAFDEACLLL